MMRHFDMKRYPRKRGKRFIHYFGGAIIQGGPLFDKYSRKYGTSSNVSHPWDLILRNSVLLYLPNLNISIHW